MGKQQSAKLKIKDRVQKDNKILRILHRLTYALYVFFLSFCIIWNNSQFIDV